MTKKTVLVTGGAGFIGKHTVNALNKIDSGIYDKLISMYDASVTERN